VQRVACSAHCTAYQKQGENMAQPERNQGKGRIIGMDIHPTVFSASALENTDA